MNDQVFLKHLPPMINELPVAVTVCDREGVILYMNERANITFRKYGGAQIVGTNLFLYHQGPSAVKLKELLDNEGTHAYTVDKNGIKKFIYQSPWYNDGAYSGLIELSMQIPFELPNFVRE